MMRLSVLIPVKNYTLVPFAKELIDQLGQNLDEADFELLIAEDGSDREYVEINREVNQLKGAKQLVLGEDIGRASVRNYLAMEANGDWLIFLDADSDIDSDFIANYLREIEKNEAEVIEGGTKYRDEMPAEGKLRWYYGKAREERPGSDRNKNPYSGFAANNFAILKSTFDKVRFDESLTEYGHEDTLFGKELQRKKVKIQHIDNAVYHIGLETNTAFLDKSKIAVESLFNLWQGGKLKTQDSLLLQTYIKMKPFIPVLKFFEKGFERNLISATKPKIGYFDLLKLIWLYRADKARS